MVEAVGRSIRLVSAAMVIVVALAPVSEGLEGLEVLAVEASFDLFCSDHDHEEPSLFNA